MPLGYAPCNPRRRAPKRHFRQFLLSIKMSAGILLTTGLFGLCIDGTRAAQNTASGEVPLPVLRPANMPTASPLPAFDPQRTRQLCQDSLGGYGAKYSPVSPIAEMGGCGNPNPVSLIAVGNLSIHILPPATTNCPLSGALAAWTQNVVLEAALTHFGERIVAFKNAASYVCRSRNNRPGAKMSEHAFTNALDISAFQRASGVWVYVSENWGMANAESAFLKAVHRGACEHFTTVLGPEANEDHHDHFHLDLGKHGETGTYRICE